MKRESSGPPESVSRHRSIKPWQGIAITFGGGFLLFVLVHVFIEGDLFTFLSANSPFADN